MNYTLEIFKIGFYLILVIGIIYFLSHFFKKNVLNMNSSKYLNIIDKLYLSSKAGLFLVEVNNEILLLSFSEEGIKKIENWDKEEFDMETKEMTNTNLKAKVDFKDILKKYWRRNSLDKKE